MAPSQRGVVAALFAASLVAAALPPEPVGGDDAVPTAADSAPDEAAAPQPPEELIAELFAQVQAQREEIFSAHIKYRWSLTTFQGSQNTPDHVHTLLEQYDLLGNPDSVRELVRSLNPYPTPPDPPWSTRTFHMLGEKRRTDSSSDKIQLVDGEHEMVYEGINSQLRVGHLGKSSVHLTEIEDFRSYPPRSWAGLNPKDYRLVSLDAEHLALERVEPPDAPPQQGTLTMRFDRATGVMTHLVQTQGSNRPLREIWQRALTEYPGGIVMPALRIATEYREGRLNSLRVFIIEEAEFNGPVSEDQFVMPVADGTVLVDYRFPEKRVRRTREATDDVRSILAPVSYAATPVPEGTGPNWRVILILNGVALIVIATVLWRKASVASTPPGGTAPPGHGTS